jgi:hypothetical protein
VFKNNFDKPCTVLHGRLHVNTEAKLQRIKKLNDFAPPTGKGFNASLPPSKWLMVIIDHWVIKIQIKYFYT